MGYKIDPKFTFGEKCLKEIKEGEYVECQIEGIRCTLYPDMPKIYLYDIRIDNEYYYNVGEEFLEKI